MADPPVAPDGLDAEPSPPLMSIFKSRVVPAAQSLPGTPLSSAKAVPVSSPMLVQSASMRTPPPSLPGTPLSSAKAVPVSSPMVVQSASMRTPPSSSRVVSVGTPVPVATARVRTPSPSSRLVSVSAPRRVPSSRVVSVTPPKPVYLISAPAYIVQPQQVLSSPVVIRPVAAQVPYYEPAGDQEPRTYTRKLNPKESTRYAMMSEEFLAQRIGEGNVYRKRFPYHDAVFGAGFRLSTQNEDLQDYQLQCLESDEPQPLEVFGLEARERIYKERRQRHLRRVLADHMQQFEHDVGLDELEDLYHRTNPDNSQHDYIDSTGYWARSANSHAHYAAVQTPFGFRKHHVSHAATVCVSDDREVADLISWLV